MRTPRPSEQDLKLLDPDGSFQTRLETDRQAIAQNSDTGDLGELARIVHGLAGAAGTFGYAALGTVAIELDDRFVAGEPVLAADIARLLAALEHALGKGKSA